MPPNNAPLSGVLRRLDENESVKALLEPRTDLSDWVTLVEGAWYRFTWTTRTEQIKLTLRDGKDRFLLLANEQTFVSAFLDISGLVRRVRRPRILVSQFVKNSVAPVDGAAGVFERLYRISGVFAEVTGYGRSLQTVALWGDDLLNAELFDSLLPKIEPYRVTVREMVGHSEVASVGSKGEVSFFHGSTAHLKRVDAFFWHLKRQQYIRWGSQVDDEPNVEFDPAVD